MIVVYYFILYFVTFSNVDASANFADVDVMYTIFVLKKSIFLIKNILLENVNVYKFLLFSKINKIEFNNEILILYKKYICYIYLFVVV